MTGVQTCALPISSIARHVEEGDDVTLIALSACERSLPPDLQGDTLRREFDAAPKSADWSELIDLEPLKIPIGSVVTLRVTAFDHDNVAGPNRGDGAELLLRVVAEDEGQVEEQDLRKELAQRRVRRDCVPSKFDAKRRDLRLCRIVATRAGIDGVLRRDSVRTDWSASAFRILR